MISSKPCQCDSGLDLFVNMNQSSATVRVANIKNVFLHPMISSKPSRLLRFQSFIQAFSSGWKFLGQVGELARGCLWNPSQINIIYRTLTVQQSHSAKQHLNSSSWDLIQVFFCAPLGLASGLFETFVLCKAAGPWEPVTFKKIGGISLDCEQNLKYVKIWICYRAALRYTPAIKLRHATSKIRSS